MSDIANGLMLRKLLEQYLRDGIGQQIWSSLVVKDEIVALRSVFLEGACFDFAAALSELTGWPVYEIQWGTAMVDDPTECDLSDYCIHRVVLHPSGRYLDASGWTDMQGVLARVGRQAATFQWMGEVDPDYGPFDVDYELVKLVVMTLLPDSQALPIPLQACKP